MRRTVTTLAACVSILFGCSYHNVLYNSERVFNDAEAHRRAGRDSLSEIGFRSVVRKTGEAYRARPESEWACQALLLLGRAHLRLGDLRAARAAFGEAAVRGGDCGRFGDVDVYLAAIAVELGDRSRALDRLNRALDGSLSDHAAAEAHLLRGGLLLSGSRMEQGWWDLDRAVDFDPAARAAAGLTALRWSVERGDLERSRRAMERLFEIPEAGIRADSVVLLAGAARARWNAGTAAELLDGVVSATWDRPARAVVALYRARLLHASGDTAAARLQAMTVASGLGSVAADARLLLAEWRLQRARDLREVYLVRALLLPSGSDPRVSAVLAAIAEMESFAEMGLDRPLGWFAAAEIARDRLQADFVARGFLLAYADAAPGDPWTPKALLAALEVTDAVGDRQWLTGRLEAHRDSPYVLAALGGPAAGFEALEEELEVRLSELSRQ